MKERVKSSSLHARQRFSWVILSRPNRDTLASSAMTTFPLNFISCHMCIMHSNTSCAIALSSLASRSPAPPPEGTSASPAPLTPAAAIPAAPSVTPTAPPEEEDPALSPHLLLPDSLSQLEEFGRQKKWHKRQNKHQRPRQFNDLWVRIEDR